MYDFSDFLVVVNVFQLALVMFVSPWFLVGMVVVVLIHAEFHFRFIRRLIEWWKESF